MLDSKEALNSVPGFLQVRGDLEGVEACLRT